MDPSDAALLAAEADLQREASEVWQRLGLTEFWPAGPCIEPAPKRSGSW